MPPPAIFVPLGFGGVGSPEEHPDITVDVVGAVHSIWLKSLTERSVTPMLDGVRGMEQLTLFVQPISQQPGG